MANPADARRILILHAQAGAGHKRAAESLEIAFRSLDPTVRVHALDTMNFASRLFQRTYAQTYNTMVKRAPHVWGLIYKGLEKKRVHKGTAAARESMDRLNLRRLVKAIERFRPIAVVCTHFLPMAALSHLSKNGKLGAPLYCVITDFGAHPMWGFEGVTGYFVASAEGREDLAEWGIQWESIWVTGIPIDPRFSTRIPKEEARISLGLRPDEPVVLVMGGGNGVGPLHDMAERLLAIPSRPQVVVMTGRNEQQLKRLQELQQRHATRLHPLGFTDQIDRWLDAADVNVTKAGGLTSSETLAKQVPMVIYKPTPGQEDQNSRALTAVGAALRAGKLEYVAETVERILTRPTLARAMQEACKFLGRPNAAADIATRVLQETVHARGDHHADDQNSQGA